MTPARCLDVNLARIVNGSYTLKACIMADARRTVAWRSRVARPEFGDNGLPTPPLGSVRYLRAADGRSRRKAAIRDREGGLAIGRKATSPLSRFQRSHRGKPSSPSFVSTGVNRPYTALPDYSGNPRRRAPSTNLSTSACGAPSSAKKRFCQPG
jgi:hypothetical protein